MPKILVVEDMATNRELISRILEMHGFEHVHAEDGEQAVKAAGSEHPDLILMDMGLPVIDGWTATRQIKESEATRAIPIIALTAHTMDSEIKKALDAGCSDYVSKPISDFEQLIKKINSLLQGSTA